MSTWHDFYGPNAGYALELYERYQQDPNAVDPATRALFESLPPPDTALDTASTSTTLTAAAPQRAAPQYSAGQHFIADNDVARIVGAARLARSIREFGHLDARIDPLDAPRLGDPMLDPATHGLQDADLAALPPTIVWRTASTADGSCLDAIGRLREIYSGPLGYDYDHIQDFAERAWLHAVTEGGDFRALPTPEERYNLLRRLTQVEEFERFLHTTFVGQKRFSLEGTDSLVPMLDELIRDAAEAGTREVLIAMAHRGRLNVLAHVLGKSYAAIFAEFHSAPNKDLVPSEGSRGINYGWTGDVKYHLGAQKALTEGDLVQVMVTLANNPSHLEFVNPAIEGAARASQERRNAPGVPRQDVDAALAVLIHGDTAFPGEGVVAETLNMSRLPGYHTGGTIHIIVNNQVGFTTQADDGRSTLYASDLAKGFEIPIVHVNADDPDACRAAVKLAHAYRDRFHKDFLIDLVGYRRWGHNEGDEPAFTQPLLYAKIAQHPTVRARYAEQLIAEGLITADEAEAPRQEAQQTLQAALQEMQAGQTKEERPPLAPAPSLADFQTAVPVETLRDLNEALLTRPDGFTVHPKLERLLARRRAPFEAAHGQGQESAAIDWAHAEALAFATILVDGTPIRLTGQDSERGTFSQRHLVLHDPETGASITPLQALPQARAAFAVYNSPLSEAAPLGFEYGYSVHAPSTLVLWEAQFGDFANAGQVLLDQFIVAARAKWRVEPSLVLLLPHGYEGQGPEHSSARLERYLQLAAEDNLRIANCTTAAQYFHLLRLQAATLDIAPRPLVLMTPKSLLRHPRAASPLHAFSDGRFQPVLDDPTASGRRELVERLIFCSGKVAIDLATSTQPTPVDWVAVARVELLYPFPREALEAAVARYPNLQEVVWLQEEPQNMGAWNYVAPRLRELLSDLPLRYIGRPERASTAEGSAARHAAAQARIIEAAFGGERQAKLETHGVQNVG